MASVREVKVWLVELRKKMCRLLTSEPEQSGGDGVSLGIGKVRALGGFSILFRKGRTRPHRIQQNL